MSFALDNIFNLRDLGGLPVPDGRRVAGGRVFRADGLHRAGTDDRRRLDTLGLRTVIDLRSDGERERFGAFPAAEVGAELVRAPLLTRLWQPEQLKETPDVEEFLVARYLELASERTDLLRHILELLADTSCHAAVFHCSAGKDRTGVVAALVLSAVGVSDEHIAADYARTSAAMPHIVDWVHHHAPPGAETMADVPPPFLACPPEAMFRFLEELTALHGSMDGYFHHIGVSDHTRDALGAALLVDHAPPAVAHPAPTPPGSTP